MAERLKELPDWFVLGGEVVHSPVKIGRRLPGWVGNESVGGSEEEFIDLPRNHRRNGQLPAGEIAPTPTVHGKPDPTL